MIRKTREWDVDKQAYVEVEEEVPGEQCWQIIPCLISGDIKDAFQCQDPAETGSHYCRRHGSGARCFFVLDDGSRCQSMAIERSHFCGPHGGLDGT